MADAQHTYRLKLKSIDPNRSSFSAFQEIEKLVPKLEKELAIDNGSIKIKIAREEAVPIDPVSIILIIHVIATAAKPFVEGFFKRLGEKMADHMTAEVRDVVVQPESDNERWSEPKQ